MNTKYLSVYPQWHCRNGGGLFVGIRFQFPVTNYDSEAFASNHTISLLCTMHNYLYLITPLSQLY